MAKVATTKQCVEEAVSGFAIPFSLEAFRDDIAAVYLHYVRCIAWMTDAETAWPITNTTPPENVGSIFYTDCTASDLGITYDKIANTTFAVYMECLYNYAFLGRVDANKEAMEEESIYTWYSTLLCDAARGELSFEYEEYGTFTREAAERCLLVAETANARRTLEGNEPFFARFQYGKDSHFLSGGVLTIRQMSLLSGMEEMSIRAAANPKKPNALVTTKTDFGTGVEIEVAEQWLRSKGKYIEVVKQWSAGEVDLSKRAFAEIDDFGAVIYSRLKMLMGDADKDVEKKLKKLGMESAEKIVAHLLAHDPADINSVKRIEALGEVLDLDPELLWLRAKEAEAQEQLARVTRAVKDAVKRT